MDTDEFEIKATGPDMEDRIWTRSTMGAACSIADQAVGKLGYTRAVVVNTYGGHRSDELYVKVRFIGYSCTHCGGGHMGIHCPEDY